jgi:hypothetical protein
MLTFNDLLHTANLDPAVVRLVRHRDPQIRVQRAAFEAAPGSRNRRCHRITRSTRYKQLDHRVRPLRRERPMPPSQARAT